MSANLKTCPMLRYNTGTTWLGHELSIHPFPMLIATGSFSPKTGIPVKFCVDFKQFKYIVMSALLHSKTLSYFEMLLSQLYAAFSHATIVPTKIYIYECHFENN